jgi:hypothetical protein
MKCTLHSQLWVHSSFKFNAWEQEEMSASDNFDKELMMDHELDKLPQLLRQVITSSPELLKKSSTYNNLVAMTATVVCSYNQTRGFSWHGQGPQSVFMNCCVHHYMRIASSTLQNWGIYYFIFDDILYLSRGHNQVTVEH